MYVLPAINNKLRHYPEFAKALGMVPGSVTDCATARTWYDGYVKYSNANHRFDVDEPVDVRRTPPPAPLMHPPVVNGPSSTAEVPKIYNGTIGANPVPFGGFFPVVNLKIPKDLVLEKNVNAVRFEFQKPGLGLSGSPGSQCTGTFIAKHWITTAAHCILPRAAWTEMDYDGGTGLPDVGAVAWLGYYGYTIQWSDTAGNVIYSLGSGNPMSDVQINLLQIPDPDYPGMNPQMGYPEVRTHDFALLYVPQDFDGALPPDAATSSWAVSLVDPDPSWNLTVWGWGTTSNTGGKSNVLYSAPVQPNALSNNTDDTFTVVGPSSSAYGGVCPGDSGGPWVRQVTSSDTGQPQTIIVGTTSITGPVATGGAADICQTDSTIAAYTPSIAHEINFINQELQWWNGPNFSCTPQVSSESLASGSGTPDYALCYGPSCSTTSDCPNSPFSCVNPSADPAMVVTCTICDLLFSEISGFNPMSGDCSCVKGQCIVTQ
jgi:hypothetical protein